MELNLGLLLNSFNCILAFIPTMSSEASSTKMGHIDDSVAYPYMDCPVSDNFGDILPMLAMILSFMGTTFRQPLYGLISILFMISVFSNSKRNRFDYKQMITISVLALSCVIIPLYTTPTTSTTSSTTVPPTSHETIDAYF